MVDANWLKGLPVTPHVEHAMTGAVPPELVTGEVAVTPVTVPVPGVHGGIVKVPVLNVGVAQFDPVVASA